METTQEKQKGIFKALKDKFSYSNPMQSPRLEKIVISVGVGSITDKDKIEVVKDRLARITGQKPAARGAKKSVASFKIREGDTVGYQVTLRGKRMKDFFDRLIHVALPRTRDFHGVKLSALDDMGNYTLGIKEHTIFPETSDEELKNVFGMAITIVTSSNTKEETEAFLKELGMPFEGKEK